MRIHVGLLTFVMFCTMPLLALCQQVEDVQNITLDSVLVAAKKNTSAIRQESQGVMKWKMKAMNDLPKILGNADPIHYTQMLPGVQTNGEYKGGINIQGCENSHNYLSIGGVPIYNVNHLLGFFSSFNASHFSTLSLQKSMSAASTPNRLGGMVSMDPAMEPLDSLSGEYAVGLMSSQGTLRVPITQRTSLILSLRDSYMNLLYGHWLNQDGNCLKYSFYDANATLIHKINSAHTLLFDSYAGQDKMAMDNGRYAGGAKANWGNAMAAFHWTYAPKTDFHMKHSLYATTYSNNVHIGMQEQRLHLPSKITEYGYKGSIAWQRCNIGMDASLYDIHQQDPDIEGLYEVERKDSPKTRSSEVVVFGDYSFPICQETYLIPGIRSTYYHIDNHSFFSACPSVELRYEHEDTRMSLQYYNKNQYLFQSGFSDIGLPTEFWFSSSRKNKPQSVHGFSLSCSSDFLQRRWTLSAELFYKKLNHQIEYCGTPFDFLSSSFSLGDALLHGKGENYGGNIMLNKNFGTITGWVTYSYTKARRTFDHHNPSRSFSASHERPHEIDALATWHINQKWDVGCTFVYASGTPYTPLENIYMISEHLVALQGDYNSCRLAPYTRLDVSCNYKWKSKRGAEKGLNLSIYNALFRSNQLFYYISMHHNGTFAYRPTSFVIDALPSISYFCKF